MNKRLLAVIIIQFLFFMAAGHLCYGDTPSSNDGNSKAAFGSAGSESNMILAQAGDEETPAPTAVPAISIPETSFDFGNVAQATKVSHKFVIKNTGEAPLKLISAKGS